MEPLEIIKKYYKEDSDIYNLLVSHSRDVMLKSLRIATMHPELNADLKFLSEAAMIHDIGMNMTYVPRLECYGIMPYLCHGYIGREIMEKEGYPKHGLVCERHVGVGLRKEDVVSMSLPLPLRDMYPITIEEKIITFADCFFSKGHTGTERTLAETRKIVEKFENKNSVAIFDEWCRMFL